MRHRANVQPESMPRTALAHIHCITLEGSDARRFAQAQFAGDADALTPGHWQWNAWLNAQGRIRLLMHLVDLGADRLLVVPRGGDVEAARTDLARYLLRSRATLTPTPLVGYADGPAPRGAAGIGQGEWVLGYGERSLRLAPATDAVIDPAAAAQWRLADIRAGWPNLPTGDARFLPPALGLGRLGATAFDKGCYPGQEIVARLHYRGGHKLRLHHIRGTALLPLGPALECADGVRVWALDCVSAGSLVEALVVASENIPLQFNVMQSMFDVVSTFDV
jgi:folate-binding protein YgfZ